MPFHERYVTFANRILENQPFYFTLEINLTKLTAERYAAPTAKGWLPVSM